MTIIDVRLNKEKTDIMKQILEQISEVTSVEDTADGYTVTCNSDSVLGKIQALPSVASATLVE